MFVDRKDAGQQLAEALSGFEKENPLVLAIPRGGVIVAAEVARQLNADFSLLVSRKLPYPFSPEAGFGAVAEDGSLFLIPGADQRLNQDEIWEIIDAQREVIEQRIAVLRKNKPLPEITGRNVILIDDGIAMGSTMSASINLCINKKANRIIVAVPVAGPRIVPEIERMVDDLIVLETPQRFRAVAQVYKHWHDVTDEEALAVLNEFNI